MSKGSYNDFFDALGLRESSNRYDVTNIYGSMGRYQMGEASFVDIGLYVADANPYDNVYGGTFSGKYSVFSVSDFLSNPAAQDQAIRDYMALQFTYLAVVWAYDGQTINNVKITVSGLLAAAHILGWDGAQAWLTSGGDYVPADNFGTKITEYATLLGDYETPFAIDHNGPESITGGSGTDILTGRGGNDTLAGKGGDDTLTGGTGIDTFAISHGTDSITDLGGADILVVSAPAILNATLASAWTASAATTNFGLANLTSAGFGVDLGAVTDGTAGYLVRNIGAGAKFIGSALADSLTGGSGRDTLLGGAGNDTLDGGAGNDALTGGDGTDTATYASASTAVTVSLAQTSSQNTVGAGTDTLASIENLMGSAYNDTLTGDANANGLSGGAGNDTMMGGAANDTLDGGAGNDVLTGGDGTDTGSYVNATAGVTVDLSLTTAQATGGAGTDTLAAIESLTGSNFNDLLTGTATVNQLEGGSGVDTLVGGAGADLLYGGDGDDRFVIAAFADLATGEIVNGGAGNDELRFTSTTASTLTLASGVALEKVVIGTGTAASADSSGTIALSVNAASAANGLSMLGNAGANSLTGTGYNDSIDGGLGNDTLTGGAGNDTLMGAGGKDNLIGGAGADTFVFNVAPNATSNLDTITDFTSGTDHINLAKSVMAALGTVNAALIANAFWQGAGVVKGHDASDRIVYNTSTGVLYYDADGSGSGAAVKLAQLGTTASHPASLTAADFFVF